ncbi:hypothetical protein BDR22DRAFT_697150 [Usnea florida]
MYWERSNAQVWSMNLHREITASVEPSGSEDRTPTTSRQLSLRPRHQSSQAEEEAGRPNPQLHEQRQGLNVEPAHPCSSSPSSLPDTAGAVRTSNHAPNLPPAVARSHSVSNIHPREPEKENQTASNALTTSSDDDQSPRPPITRQSATKKRAENSTANVTAGTLPETSKSMSLSIIVSSFLILINVVERRSRERRRKRLLLPLY